MTLSDIKLAFELATTGELDDYLPKDSKGKPDKSHYQNFNADYFAKILNAYKRKQSEVVGKAYNAVPRPKKELSPDEIRFYERIRVETNQRIFLQYKYRGELIFGAVDEMLVYNWLVAVGLANPVTETERDRKQALSRFLDRAARNMVNPHIVYHVKQKGIDSPFTAFEIARRRDAEMRAMIDEAMGVPVCDALFGGMNVYAVADGLPVWCNLMLAIFDLIDTTFAAEQKKTNPRIAKYTAKYQRK